MARFVTIAFASVLFTAPVQAQVAPNPAQNPWHVSDETKASPNFDIADDPSMANGSASKGSMIIAGTEVTSNAVVGFGIFGEKSDPPQHARSTNRDYSLPKTRKAAVGVALRF